MHARMLGAHVHLLMNSIIHAACNTVYVRVLDAHTYTGLLMNSVIHAAYYNTVCKVFPS